VDVNRKQAIAWAQHIALKGSTGQRNPRREEHKALAERILSELGDSDSLSITLNEREQFLTASHRPVAKHIPSCQTKWRR